MSDRTDTYYAAADSIHGYGAQLMCGNGASPEVFEAIAGVEKITFGQMATADIKPTHLRSPDAHEEHRPGMRDTGAFSVGLIWLPLEESQSNTGGGTGAFSTGGLIAKWRNRTTHNWKVVVFNDGSPSIELPFRSYVSQFQPGEIGKDDVIRATAAFQPTEAPDADWP